MLGFFIVLAGIVMSGPGVPGPGILVILIGLSFLALEFDWAERWLERAISLGRRRGGTRRERTSLAEGALGRTRRRRDRRLRGRGDPVGHPPGAGVIQRLFNELTRAHTLSYRLTGGLVGQHVPGLPPMLLLDHVGAKSGKKRTTPLVFLRDATNLVIVASKGGLAAESRLVPQPPREPRDDVCRWLEATRRSRRRVAIVRRSARGCGRRPSPPMAATTSYQGRTRREIPLVILES